MKDTIDKALVLCYNLAILAGTVCLIEFYDWSAWWLLLGVGLTMSFTMSSTKRKD